MFRALLALSVLLIAQAALAKQNMIVKAFPGKVTLTVDLGITATYSGKTDVLFVVDNSGSMGQHQTNLIKNIPILVDGLMQSKIDFNAAVVTTDMGGTLGKPCCGEFAGHQKVVSRTTPDAAKVLAKNLDVGVSGSGTEEIFGAIQTSLSPQMLTGVNAGFFRNDAFLAIVFVTDAEDQSKIGALDLTNFLKTLKPGVDMISAQGIMVPSTETTCNRDDGTTKPVRLEEFLKAFNGAQFSLCTPNYPGQMKTVTDNIIISSQKGQAVPPHPSFTRIPLPNVPDFKSISVTWGKTVLAAGDLSYGWVYDRAKNEIVLGDQIDWSVEVVTTPLTVNYVPQDWK